MPPGAGDTGTVKTGLVLGGGGLVGLAYHAGVLWALESEAGFSPSSADLVVGTSAGAVIGAYLRTGWTPHDFWEAVHNRHPRQEAIGGPDHQAFTPAYGSPFDFVRRGVGSAYVAGRSVLRLPTPPLPSRLQRAFPGGLFSIGEVRDRLEAELPETWPTSPLWLCTVNLATGRRIVLGRGRAPKVPLATGVLASCAIPGVYSPVRAGGLTLVDGGAYSTSNLDLAVKDDCDLVIGIVPLAFDTAAPPGPVMQLARRVPARALASEVSFARARGAQVLLLRPTGSEVRQHGLNLMRATGLEAVAQAAYEATARAVGTARFQEALAG